jgi:hypothetical protein
LRYGKEIKIPDLFPLLSLEMLHRRVEIEKQDLEEVLLRFSRQNRTSFSGGREPISGRRLKRG